MGRADRLSRLISEWQEDRRELKSIRDYFAASPRQQQLCVTICDFGLTVLDRCIDDFQRANYPLDQPETVDAVDPVTAPGGAMSERDNIREANARSRDTCAKCGEERQSHVFIQGVYGALWICQSVIFIPAAVGDAPTAQEQP